MPRFLGIRVEVELLGVVDQPLVEPGPLADQAELAAGGTRPEVDREPVLVVAVAGRGDSVRDLQRHRGDRRRAVVALAQPSFCDQLTTRTWTTTGLSSEFVMVSASVRRLFVSSARIGEILNVLALAGATITAPKISIIA